MPKLIEKPNLPKEIFAQKVVAPALSQATRVYLANQRQGTQSALTRAQVSRTRKKVFKQKGTGNARHGDRKAPIFVGGGVAFAPKPRSHALALPTKMKKTALFGALTAKATDKSVFIVSGMSDLSGKTSDMVEFLDTLQNDANKNFQQVLIVTNNSQNNVYRASRNIAGVTVLPVAALNVYQVLKADKILIMQEAVELIGKSLLQEKKTDEVKSTTKIEKPVSKKVSTTKVKVESKTKAPLKKTTVKKKKNKYSD